MEDIQVRLLKECIKQLEEENLNLKERLSKYTRPACQNTYYQKNKDKIIARNTEYAKNKKK